MIRSCEPVCFCVVGFSSYPITRLPVPLTAPFVAPDPDTICTFTAANRTVGSPPTPLATNVGASTAVVPDEHDGADPVPPEMTGCPAVVGMHSHPGGTAAKAPPASTNPPAQTTSTAPNRDAFRAPMTTPLSAPPRTTQHATGQRTQKPQKPAAPTGSEHAPANTNRTPTRRPSQANPPPHLYWVHKKTPYNKNYYPLFANSNELG